MRNLQVDESDLTGKSVPVEKDTQPIASETSLAERTNMAYAGSLLVIGSTEQRTAFEELLTGRTQPQAEVIR